MSLIAVNAQASKDYTTSTEKNCNNGICTITQYSGIRFVQEDNIWKPIEEARSLKNKGYSVLYIENDPTLELEIIDFNYTSLTYRAKVKGDKVGTQVPIEVYEIDNNFRSSDWATRNPGRNPTWKDRTIKRTEKSRLFASESDEFVEQIYFSLGHYLKLGSNSTVITLQENETQNLEDGHVEQSDNPGLNHGKDQTMLLDSGRNWQIYMKWNNSLPQNSTVLEAYLLLTELYDDFNPIHVYHVYNDTWNEDIINWTDQPCGPSFNKADSCNLTASSNITTAGGITDVDKFNVTQILQADLRNNTFPNKNFSLFLRQTPGAIQQIYFWSKESPNATRRPILNITYLEANISSGYSGTPWALNDWNFRVNITIQNNFSVAMKNASIRLDITDFPEFSEADYGPNGSNIMFTDSIGTNLSHVVEIWKPKENQSIVWVNATIPSQSNYTIWLYFNSSIFPPQKLAAFKDYQNFTNGSPSGWGVSGTSNLKFKDTNQPKGLISDPYGVNLTSGSDSTNFNPLLPPSYNYTVEFYLFTSSSIATVDNVYWEDGGSAVIMFQKTSDGGGAPGTALNCLNSSGQSPKIEFNNKWIRTVIRRDRLTNITRLFFYVNETLYNQCNTTYASYGTSQTRLQWSFTGGNGGGGVVKFENYKLYKNYGWNSSDVTIYYSTKETKGTQSSPDNSPPVISSLTNSTSTNQSVVITWSTSKSANETNTLGICPSHKGIFNNSNNTFGTSHIQSIASLINSTTYCFNTTACNSVDNCSSANVSFKTAFNIFDSDSPSFTSLPTNISTTNSTVKVSWASDEQSNYTIVMGVCPAFTGAFSLSNNTLRFSHNVSIASLVNSTRYCVNVTISDAYYNRNWSNFSFLTAQNPDRIPPNLSSYNMTSEGGLGCTNWNTNKSNPCITNQTKPAVKFITDENASCAIGVLNLNYTNMGGSRNCTVGDGTINHTCTLTQQDELVLPNSTLHISCKDKAGNQQTGSSSGDLKINIFAKEEGAVRAIGVGVQNALLGSYQNFTYQIVSGRTTGNTIFHGTFDWMAKNSSKAWLLNYVNSSEQAIPNLKNLSAVYVLQLWNTTQPQITLAVEKLINATK